MAQISKKHLFTLNRKIWGDLAGKVVKVGHNRTLRLDPAGHLDFALYGNVVAQVCEGEIWLDHCGYKGPTTNAAMRDFMRACGIIGAVSFAGGSVKGWYRNYKGDSIAMEKRGEMLYFPIPAGGRLCAK